MPTKANARKRPAARGGRAAVQSPIWELRLYVAGQSPRCLTAFANLKAICEEHLSGRYRIAVIDLLTQPALARGDEILAVPTLVRALPTPVRKIIGDLSRTERVLVGLDIRPLAHAGASDSEGAS